MARVKNWGAVGVEPPAAKLNEGWQEGERPPAEYFNWFFNQATSGINGVDSDLGDRSALKTTDKGSVVAAVNEVQDKKVDKVTGKGLSTNDYTTAEKNKLAGIAAGATNYVHPATHPFTMITGAPISYPANGGNADTVDGKHASDFAAAGSAKKYVTLVVGTSTSGHTTTDVDYLCDGTADDVEINAAIQALPEGGGKILIREGAYDISAQIEIDKDSVSIEGMGASTCLIRTFRAGNLVPSGVLKIKSSYVVVNSMKIMGEFTSSAIIKGDTSYGIWITNEATSIRVIDIELNNHTSTAIHISGDNCAVENCKITKSGDRGIHISQGPGLIANNYVRQCTEGICISTYYVSAYGNILMNNSEGDIAVASDANYNVISGNHCRSSKNITLEGLQLLVTNNLCYGQTATIRAMSNSSYCLITGNFVFLTNIANAGTENTVTNNKYSV